MREAVAWFGANVDQDEVLARISRACGPAHWTLGIEKVKVWLDRNRHNLLLWLNGSPGAGKSHMSTLFWTAQTGTRTRQAAFLISNASKLLLTFDRR